MLIVNYYPFKNDCKFSKKACIPQVIAHKKCSVQIILGKRYTNIINCIIYL